MKKVAGLAAIMLLLSGNIIGAQQKPKPKAINVTQSVQTALTERIQKERKTPSLTVTLDTSAPYTASANAKGLRGTGTILMKKTGKREMFAYDVLVNAKNGTPTRLSYRPMKGVVTTRDDTPMDYKIDMAQTAIRQSIQRKFSENGKNIEKGKSIIVSFKSAIPVVISAKVTQIKGEGGYTDRIKNTKFRYSATVDAANGRVSNVGYEVIPESQKVKR